jgi:hypothetical protein
MPSYDRFGAPSLRLCDLDRIRRYQRSEAKIKLLLLNVVESWSSSYLQISCMTAWMGAENFSVQLGGGA